jgi:hypothetical protein
VKRGEKRGKTFKILKEKRNGWMKKAVWMNYGKQENTYIPLDEKRGGWREKKQQN